MILTELAGKGKSLLIIFFCLPFAQFPGLAIPFGLIIAFFGFKMAFKNNRIWLPSFLLRKKINEKLLKKIIQQIQLPIKKIAPLTHPRYPIFWKNQVAKIINGCLIGITGICLSLSLPIPLSSLLACIAILLLGLGILNDDGLLIAIAYPLILCYTVFVLLTLSHVSLKDIYQWIQLHI